MASLGSAGWETSSPGQCGDLAGRGRPRLGIPALLDNGVARAGLSVETDFAVQAGGGSRDP